MTRPDHDDARPDDRPRPLVVYDRPAIRPTWKTGPRIAKLRRMADAMRAVAGAGEPVPHEDAVAWNVGRPDMLTLRTYGARVSNDVAMFELRTGHGRSGRNSLILGVIAPADHDRVIRGGDTIVELAAYADLLANALETGGPVSGSTWRNVVEGVVLAPIAAAGWGGRGTFHVARSPLHEERLSQTPDNPLATNGSATYTRVAHDSGLPGCMLGMIDEKTLVPMLVSMITDTDDNAGSDPVAALRAIEHVSAVTGWTPPASTPNAPPHGNDA